MASKKRRSETAQMRKEDIEAAMNDEQEDWTAVENQLLSRDEMKGRRFVRVKRPENTQGLILPQQQQQQQQQQPAESNNASKNPFANISLASSSAKNPSFSFPILTSATGQQPAVQPTNFGIINSMNNNNNNISKQTKEFCQKLVDMDKALVTTMIDADLGFADQSKALWEYVYYRTDTSLNFEKQQQEEEKQRQQQQADQPATVPTPAPSRPKLSQTSAEPKTSLALSQQPKNNFGSFSNTNMDSNKIQPKASSSSTPSFSFGTLAPSTQPTTTSDGGFAFHSIPSQSTTSLPPKVVQEDNNNKGSLESTDAADGDNNDIPETEEPYSTLKVEDPDWDTLDSLGPITVYHMEDPKQQQQQQQQHQKDSTWKPFATGSLELQVKKDDGKLHRMVMRMSSGIKVLINMKIVPGMKFVYNTYQNKKKNQKYGLISFSGVNSSERGFEVFRIKASEQVALTLHQKLQELAAKSKS